MIPVKDFYTYNYKNIIKGKDEIDSIIFTFDIESTSYILLHGKQYTNLEYINFSEKEKELCIFQSTMYIWQFSINDKVYYGRTWLEFVEFLALLDQINPAKKIIFVHNLSFEFNFIKSVLNFKKVMCRKSHKVMQAILQDYNIEFRCTYFMSNCSLEQLAKVYNLEHLKLKGQLDYNKIRHSETPLDDNELKYCENDCLVVYEYIKIELDEYKTITDIPLTSTGHVRRECKDVFDSDPDYKSKTYKSININPHIYNMMQDAFAGGYTHANFYYTDKVVENVTSYDFTSSYPYCLLAFPYPMSEFRKCYIKDIKQLSSNLCYLIDISFTDIKSKYYNNFISQSKCKEITHGKYDNGRVISADNLRIIITDVDLDYIVKAYSFKEYKINEIYFATKDYLPKVFIDFILQKYIEKTQYKNLKGYETEYIKSKNRFNSLYGMAVTQTIRDEVEYSNTTMEFTEIPLTNEQIIKKLNQEKRKCFMSFSWRCILYSICT